MVKLTKIPGKLAASAAVVALLGAGGGSLAVNLIAHYEGLSTEAYQDPVGIWTKCFGDTKDVTPGETYTVDQCVQSLNDQVAAHAAPILDCVPGLERQSYKVQAAMVSMAYNIGVSAFCKSSVATRANDGNWDGACRRIAEIYKTAGGKELPGLVRRRSEESKLCLQGLTETMRASLVDPSEDDLIWLDPDDDGFDFGEFGPGDEEEPEIEEASREVAGA